MKIIEGNKYIHKNTERSIIDIKIDDTYTIYVFKGSLSKNDIVVKYSKFGKRLRTPKHIHWVIDILLKEQKNHNSTIAFIECMQKTWGNIEGLQNNDYNTIKDILNKHINVINKKIEKSTLEGGEYPIDFVMILLLLLMIQEKTNRTDAYMFNRILDELLKKNMDIFSIVSTATLSKRF